MRRAPSGLELAGVPRRLWPALGGAEHRMLMLDYDGTLAPFTAPRGRARPARGAVRLITRIAADRRATVAIVSGRPIADLIGLLGLLPVVMIGEHGWETRRPDGSVARRPLARATAAGLRRAEAAARALGAPAQVERKRAAVVLHTRGLPAGRAAELERAGRRAWEGIAARAGLRLDRIDGGLEIRARSCNKGIAVRALLDAAPSGTVAAYLGDDASDEDAFRALRSRGFAIRVGPGERTSLAGGRLPSIQAVETFLERWLEVVRSPDRS